MSPVKVITVYGVADRKLIQAAVTAFVKDWVKRRNDAGESTLEIAKSLGFKSHASVVQYLTPGHTVQVTDAVQRSVAEILFHGSRDRLDEEALRWYAKRKPDAELPPAFKAAITFLNESHGRDFTQAAIDVFKGSSHRAEKMTIDSLAAQIYERAQQAKGKAPKGSGPGGGDEPAGAKKKRK